MQLETQLGLPAPSGHHMHHPDQGGSGRELAQAGLHGRAIAGVRCRGLQAASGRGMRHQAAQTAPWRGDPVRQTRRAPRSHDPTAAIAPSADLVAWSRLGSSYSPAELGTALADRTLLELRAMIRPGEDLAPYRAEMAGWERAGRGELPGRRGSGRDWVRANDACRLNILDRLGSSAAAAVARSSGHLQGAVAADRVDQQPFSGRAVLLSPFDRLMHDRKRTVEFFEFDYQLDTDKPAAKRRWGTSRYRSCTATGWRGSSTPPPTAKPGCCGSTRSTRTCPSTGP
jgi:hypothetical protein